VDSNKCSEDLSLNHVYVMSSRNPVIDDYNQIFYMIDKGNILSIHFKMSLRRPKSMRKADCLLFIFIDFYVPALTPPLNSTDLLIKQ
jgi:hypothetical protein